MTEEDHTTANEADDDRPADEGFEPSRRTFLRGGGALAASAPLFGGATGTAGALDGDLTATQPRRFDVHATEVDIVYNRFGLHQPNGAMYVLEENLDAVKEASGVTPDDGFALIDGDDPREGIDTSVIEPLVIRANRGQTVEITFHNDLDRPASIHQTSLPYDVQTADGMAVGFNEDTVAQPGESVTYRWYAESEGGKFFYDGANQAVATADAPPQEANLLSRGLFGTLVVEPPGATWTDPETGDPLRSGLRADIQGPIGPQVGDTSYREFVLHYHTPEGVYPDLTWPGTDVPQTLHAINYRADPTGQRVNDEFEDSDIEKGFYNSWTNGDPGGGDNVYEVYKGDPVKFVFTSASGEENHIHHLHNHRWKQVPRTGADTIDAQTVGLGEVFEAYLVAGHGPGSTRRNVSFAEAFEVGAGYVHGNAGDVLFHCHLFPHYAEGMWGFMRVHDTERPWLRPLPNSDVLNPVDSQLGFPEFVPGEKGRLPPDEPARNSPIVDDAFAASEQDARGPTQLEKDALGDIVPGAPYTDPCIDANRTIEYTLRAMRADIVYNDAGEHDPDGQFYILEEATVDGETTQVTDPEAVRNGDIDPEPLFLRANVGDCIEFTLINDLDHDVSMHQHFVGYDVLGTDSLSTGYNYAQETTAEGGTNEYRWFADEEGPIFFHDHIVGVEEVMNGQFAGLIVEPKGSEWRDPYSGDPLFSGSQAIIDPPNDESFREQALHFHDFAQLKDRDGRFINQDREHNQNGGTMAINYRNAPYYTRHDPDPAYVHSSAVHGDPETPVLEAYEDDPIKIRLFQGAYEEQHNFGLHGLRIDPDGFDPQDSVSEVIGTSEAFTFTVRPESEQLPFEKLDNPDGLPVRDYRMGSSIVDDLWCGMWGLFRIWGGEVSHLQPLPDESAPGESIADSALEDMGHPAVYSDLDWSETGQTAKRRYTASDDRRLPPDVDARRNGAVGDVPPQPPDPGSPAPDGSEPDRTYEVSAVQTQIRYDQYNDRDPHGIAFVPSVYANQIENGVRDLTPLTIRANEGELVEVTVRNDLRENRLDDDHPDPKMRIDRPWDRSSRISLHPQRIGYDVNGSDGATVGFNYDGTVAPGDSISYRWYADEPLGTTILWDFADVRSNRHHGSYGQLVIEPEESVVLTNDTAEPIPTEPACMVTEPEGGRLPDFRENALLFADGQYVVKGGPNGNCVIPPGDDADDDDPCTQLGDSEDHGYFGINYRAEPFARRFDRGSDDPALVYSSEEHGDPSTPILQALVDDPVTFRVGQAADKGRAIAFHLSGHQWQRFRGVDVSSSTGVNGQLSVGKAARYDLVGGAGNSTGSAGDYLYQETKQVRRLEGGLWGIFRVRETEADFQKPFQPLPDRASGRGGNEGKSPLGTRPGYVVESAKVTGESQADTVVGVPDSDLGAPDGGAVYVFFDTPPGQVRGLPGADLLVPSETPEDRLGQEITVRTRANQSVVDVQAASGTYTLGLEMVEVADEPPETDIAAFVRGATNANIGATVPVKAVDAWQQEE